MRVLAVAMVFGLAAPSFADSSTPLISVETTLRDNGTLEIEVEVKHPPRANPFAIGGPRKSWSDAISVTVTSSNGAVQKWPLKREDTKEFAKTIFLRSNTGAGLTFSLDKKALKAIPNGAYEVIATLDLFGAGAGFQGVATSPAIELDLGVVPQPVLPKELPGVVAALETEKARLRRRELALGLEAMLLDAPSLPPGESLDLLAKAHLKELTRRMCAPGEVYVTEPSSDRPSNAILFTYRVLISSDQLSKGFETSLRGVPLGRSAPAGFAGSAVDVAVGVTADRAEFQKWIREKKAPGLLFLPVHVRDGIARVVTSVVPAGWSPPRFFEISYWKQEKDGWRLLSFEPNSEGRDWHSNVHRLGPGAEKPAELSPTERAQWLDVVLESVDLMGGDIDLDHQFGAYVFDASYVPLLKARLDRGSATTQSAVALQLNELDVEVPTPKLLELMKRVTADQQKQELTQLAWKLLEPRFQSAHLATAEEARSIIGAELKATDKVQVLGDYAVHQVARFDSGSQTLYAKTPTGWALVGPVSRWIR